MNREHPKLPPSPVVYVDMEVPDSEVHERMLRFRMQFAKLSDIEGPVEADDICVIDIEGRRNDARMPGMCRTGHWYRIGARSPFGELDDVLVGKKVGEEFSFEATYAPVGATEPDQVRAWGTLRGVKRPLPPELTDAFVRTHLGLPTVKDWFDRTRAVLLESRCADAWNAAFRRAREMCLEMVSEPPDAVLRAAPTTMPPADRHEWARVAHALNELADAQGCDPVQAMRNLMDQIELRDRTTGRAVPLSEVEPVGDLVDRTPVARAKPKPTRRTGAPKPKRGRRK